MQSISILTWNLNGRTNKSTIDKQTDLISNFSPDIVTLQEVTKNSLEKIKNNLRDIGYNNIISSFELTEDQTILIRKRKYGQIIASKFDLIARSSNKFNIPYQERVLSVKANIQNKHINIHTTHVPPGSTNGIVKVNHLNGIYDYFSYNNTELNILSGDFNTPKIEDSKLGLLTWGQKLTKRNEIIFSKEKESDKCSAKEWDKAERNIMLGLPKLGLIDVFRYLYSYDTEDYSWISKRKGKIVSRRRYDHIFASDKFNFISAYYIHSPLETNISDHSILIANIELN